jgi:hypothetical protein
MANDQDKKGFAGLDSLITKVDPPTVTPPSPENTVPTQAPMTAAPRQVYTGTPTTGSKSSGTIGWWLIGLVLLAVIVYFSNSNNSPQSTGSYQAPSVPVQSAPEPTYSSAEETTPPVGNDLAFDRSEIRYCLSQDIRMAAWQGQVNQSSQSAIDAFNAAVTDYNARCTHYRYRDGDLESVRSEVEANRVMLTQQGIDQATSNP